MPEDGLAALVAVLRSGRDAVRVPGCAELQVGADGRPLTLLEPGGACASTRGGTSRPPASALGAPGRPPSPPGARVAAASAGGDGRVAEGAPLPVQGCAFRIPDRQRPAAPGGAIGVRAPDGRMPGGWAVVATPARDGVSGFMTFLVSHHGAVRERDLGPDTARLAVAIAAFDCGPGAGGAAAAAGLAGRRHAGALTRPA